MTALVHSPRIVIVGGGYAGVLAANRARRKLPAARITLVSDGPTFVDRVRLHEQLAWERPATSPLQEELGDVELVIGRASQLDGDELVLEDGRRLDFQHLIVAAGSITDRTRVPGASDFALGVEPDAGKRLRPVLEAGGRVVIVGGGLTGVELATELAEAHPRAAIRLVTGGEVCPALSVAARRHVRRACDRLGIALEEQRTISAIQPGSLVTTGGAVAFDACVWASGFRASPLPARLGLEVDDLGRAVVDATLRASRSNVRVAGDAALVRGALGSPIHPGCKTAMPLGAHAVDAICAELAGREAPRFALRDTGYCVSLGRRDGVVQPVNTNGSPWRWAITGSAAAFVKERVCRYVRWSLRAERDRRAQYRWVRSGEALA